MMSSKMTAETHSLRGGVPMARPARYVGAALAALALGVVSSLVPAVGGAQVVRPTPMTSIDSMRADGTMVTKQLTARQSFQLFAAEDFACGTYRSTGQQTGGLSNSGGPVNNNAAGTAACQQGLRGNFFEMPIVGGAPPTVWRKIREVFPNARNATGGGWTSFHTYSVGAPARNSIGPADGQFGKTFAGVTVNNDGSCRDDPAVYFRYGFSAMAMKDCPVTWGSEGFKGKLVVPDSVWRNRFNANKQGFTWDEWLIPTSNLDPTQTLGTQSLYSYMSDYFREQKTRFGSVVNGGVGTPVEAGYPLGIEFRIDAWQFGTPAVRNTQYYQMTLVNKSAEVYGAGIDYDSLYYGLGPGVANNQNANAFYFQPQEGTVYIVRSGASGKCNGTSYPKRYIGQTAGCNSTAGGTAGGIQAITFLKSPLGDLRNKLFTTASSPYFNPTHPSAGDTITYNHAAWGGFGNTNMQRLTRGAFGMVSGIEADYLDGRTPADLGAGDYLIKFMPEDWTGVVPDAASARFNKFVPGSTTNPATGQPFGKWDYNRDGVQDTISVPGCGKQGCHIAWSDTNPGGYRNAAWGNILNSITSGPFKLKANDTTQFLFAFTYAADTIEMRTRMDAMLTSYLTNYAGPAPIALPPIVAGVTYTVAAAELVDSTGAGDANASIGARVVIRYPQLNPTDAFFLNAINKIRQDSIANVGNTRRVLRLNPGLLDKLTARARDNVSAVYIFKSCDGGNTYTTSSGVVSNIGTSNAGSCPSAPTRNIDAGVQAFQWRPIATTTYTNGNPTAATFTDNVMGGRTYLYSLVTRSRGFSDFRIVDSTAAGFIPTDVQNAFNITLDTISSALASSGPTTITVYAPITQAAGRSFARVDTVTAAGRATQGVLVDNVSNDVKGSTRLVYGNQFIVRKTVDTLTNATRTTVTARYIVPNSTTSPTGTTGPGTIVAREQTFTAPVNIPVRVGAAVIAGTQRSISGSSRVLIDTVNALAGSTGFVWVTSDNRPIYVVDNQYATNYDRDELTSPLYPGYTVRSRDSSNAANGFRREIPLQGAERDRNFVIRAPGDTLQPNARQYVPQVQPIIANATANPNPKRIRGGSYSLKWQTDPWGPGAPFRLDPPQELEAKVKASLTEAAKLSTTITDTSSKYAAMVGATAARPLVRVRVPFSMTFTDAEDGRVEEVKFAMLRRPAGLATTRLLGQGVDTIRVNVVDSIWLPGDTLYVLQKVAKDSVVTINGVRTTVLGPETEAGIAGFRPIQVLVDSIGLNKFMVACNAGAANSGTRANTFDAQTCNPLQILTRGATTGGGYLPVGPGWLQNFEITRTFDPRSTLVLTATPFVIATNVTKESLAKVSVVPNPYVVRSDLDVVQSANNPRNSTSRLYFTGVPSQGVLRIYSVSGQFLQELTWTAADLTYTGNNSVSGDLPYNLRTREGIDLSSGLYLYVLTATGASGKDQVQRGKFVIIR